MAKTIISEGKTTAEAIEKGLKELHASREDVEIKTIEEKKKSFFSILDPHVVKVEITLKIEEHLPKEEQIREDKIIEIDPEKMKTAEEEVNRFLKEFLPTISSNITYKTKISNEFIKVELSGGQEAGKLIGYRGEALNSLQLILSTIAQNQTHSHVRILLDIEKYREKREKTLEELATKIEKTVARTGKKITLEPMSSYERKIIHTKLQDSKEVKTYSIGQDNNRRVVIIKK